MIPLYKEVAGRKLRLGFTTGSCAAAACKAATIMLLTGKKVTEIEIDTPSGIRLTLTVEKQEWTSDFARCCVIKDGGDDPDATTGLEIFAEARFSNQSGFTLKAGKGIGIVTKKGLKVNPGQPAINPIPMQMIQKEVLEICDQAVALTLFVPEGEERAKKTFNPRLGIEGGISILGTSGIVTPMSEEAWKDSIYLELKMKQAIGLKSVCFVFGNYGEEFAKNELGIEKEKIVIISNFVGFCLESAMALEIESILLVGHMGKLVKVSSGNFHTHSKVSDARMETLCAYCSLIGANKEVLNQIFHCVTTEAAEEIIEENHLETVYDFVVNQAEKRSSAYIYGKIEIGCILFGKKNQPLASSESAESILSKIRNEKIES